MLVKILKSTQHPNHGDILVGKEMELPDDYAKALIIHGYAKKVIVETPVQTPASKQPVIKAKNESKKDK